MKQKLTHKIDLFFHIFSCVFRQKGSDASWKNDREAPSESLDFSDDDDETRKSTARRRKETPAQVGCTSAAILCCDALRVGLQSYFNFDLHNVSI